MMILSDATLRTHKPAYIDSTYVMGLCYREPKLENVLAKSFTIKFNRSGHPSGHVFKRIKVEYTDHWVVTETHTSKTIRESTSVDMEVDEDYAIVDIRMTAGEGITLPSKGVIEIALPAPALIKFNILTLQDYILKISGSTIIHADDLMIIEEMLDDYAVIKTYGTGEFIRPIVYKLLKTHAGWQHTDSDY